MFCSPEAAQHLRSLKVKVSGDVFTWIPWKKNHFQSFQVVGCHFLATEEWDCYFLVSCLLGVTLSPKSHPYHVACSWGLSQLLASSWPAGDSLKCAKTV